MNREFLRWSFSFFYSEMVISLIIKRHQQFLAGTAEYGQKIGLWLGWTGSRCDTDVFLLTIFGRHCWLWTKTIIIEKGKKILSFGGHPRQGSTRTRVKCTNDPSMTAGLIHLPSIKCTFFPGIVFIHIYIYIYDIISILKKKRNKG